jgi:hypothetical protein
MKRKNKNSSTRRERSAADEFTQLLSQIGEQTASIADEVVQSLLDAHESDSDTENQVYEAMDLIEPLERDEESEDVSEDLPLPYQDAFNVLDENVVPNYDNEKEHQETLRGLSDDVSDHLAHYMGEEDMSV